MSERKTIDDVTKFRGLLQIWTEAYEESIVESDSQKGKEIIDKACYRAVQKWTKYLEDKEVIFPEETKSPQCDTVEQSIRHHIANLISGGMWTDSEETQPKITRTDDGDHVWMVEIPICEYKKACEWGLNEKRFNLEEGKFRCQRVGCFVGAIRKYLNVPNQNNVDPQKVDFFMFKVHTTNEGGCKGLLFIPEETSRRELRKKYLSVTNN